MKNKLYKTAKAVVPSLLLSLFLLPACSDNSSTTPDIPETKYAKLTITLGSADNAEPGYTKAYNPDTGLGDNDIINPDSADLKYEHHIDDWYIVVVDKSGNVDRVVSNTTTANNDHEDSETSVDMELIIGETYSFYAYANLKGLKDGGTTVIKELEGLKGKAFSSFRAQAVELAELTAYHGGTNTSYIPMSSYGETKEVKEDITQNVVNLQLIRLLGRVSVQVTNATGIDLAVKKLTMGKFRQSGSIYLLPYDASESDPADPNLLKGKSTESDLMNPVFPTGTSTASDWEHTLDANNQSIPKADPNDEKANKRSYDFYINETDQKSVDANGGDMKIALKVEGEGLERDTAAKSTNFFFIRRNDLLKIPLLISKAETTIEFEQQHMPIGGLPTQFKFTSGVDLAYRTFTTDHAGEIAISYSLNELNGSSLSGADPEWKLKYYNTGDNVNPGDHFCYAELTANTEVTSTNTGYLLEPAEKDQDQLGWWEAAGNDANKKPSCAFVLNKKMNGDTPSTYQGSFTVTVQELANSASATIKLTLVAVNKSGTEVVLPYTLIIKNKAEGGN